VTAPLRRLDQGIKATGIGDLESCWFDRGLKAARESRRHEKRLWESKMANNEGVEPVGVGATPILAAEEPAEGLTDGITLCLSGGGFRAMLYHAGALIRLNELGLLGQLSRVSSVSGGSITAGMLALAWQKLTWTDEGVRIEPASLDAEVIRPLRQLAKHTVDVSAIGWGSLNPFRSISDEVVSAYNKHLFDGASLQDLPDESLTAKPIVPRFVFTATNVKTGSLWRFAKAYMADYRVGLVDAPDVPLAVAVAASSAFPPFLSPLRLRLDDFTFREGIPAEGGYRSLRAEAVLTDGGVYDNLGLEPVWKRFKRVLISDGGRPTDFDFQPADDWPRHARRLLDLLQQQVGNLRLRQVIGDFKNPNEPHTGAYWGSGTDPTKYPASNPLDCSYDATWAIATISTRLAELSDADQERILNWGYAACDLAVRSYISEFKDFVAPQAFPFPESGLGG
jgi:NTE family protein